VDPRQRYLELNERVFDLYIEDRPDDALQLIAEAPPELSAWRAELAYLSACLNGARGRPQQALQVLEDAAAEGDWWDPSVLGGDDDLAELRDLPAYDSLLAVSVDHWRRANEATDRSGDLLTRPPGSARGLVVALHGAEENASDAVVAWSPAVHLGYAVLAVRSSQRTSPNYRTWPDEDRAAAEIDEAVGRLPDELGRLPVIAAGFSAGGRVALRWALTARPFSVAGVIAVAPAIRPDTIPADPAGPLAPAQLVVGADDDLLADVRTAADRLEPAGFALDVVPGLAHGFPADFPNRLGSWLGA
jgi:dienelactone hydrolase